MNQPMVLCYNMEGDRALQVCSLAQKVGIQPILVPREAYLQTVGALCGVIESNELAYDGDGFTEEMMLLAFIEDGMLGHFLDGFREAGLPSIPLKAILTRSNTQWNSLKLHAEVMNELADFWKLPQPKMDKKASKF